jgi:type II secretion system protein H
MFHPHHNRRNTARAAGHTLIELLVVVFLIAIAASLVLPITVRSYSSFKVRMAANSIVHLLQQAKSRSLFESRAYLVIFPEETTADREILLMREDGTTVAHYAVPADISLRRHSANDDWSSEIGPVAFYPDGSSEGLQLALESPSGSSSRIQLDPWTGQARVLLADKGQP